MVLTLAEILRTKELRQAHDLCAIVRRAAHEVSSAVQVLRPRRRACHLDQRDASLIRFHASLQQKRRRRWPTPLIVSGSNYFLSSKIRIAAAIVVVHNPFLWPTADCVTLAVRTILFEIR